MSYINSSFFLFLEFSILQEGHHQIKHKCYKHSFECVWAASTTDTVLNECRQYFILQTGVFRWLFIQLRLLRSVHVCGKIAEWEKKLSLKKKKRDFRKKIDFFFSFLKKRKTCSFVAVIPFCLSECMCHKLMHLIAYVRLYTGAFWILSNKEKRRKINLR